MGAIDSVIQTDKLPGTSGSIERQEPPLVHIEATDRGSFNVAVRVGTRFFSEKPKLIFANHLLGWPWPSCTCKNVYYHVHFFMFFTYSQTCICRPVRVLFGHKPGATYKCFKLLFNCKNGSLNVTS